MAKKIAKKAFKLNVGGEIVAYNAGEVVPPEHAEHWLAAENVVDASEYVATEEGINVEELVATNHDLAGKLAKANAEIEKLKAALAAKQGNKQQGNKAPAPAGGEEAKKD